jgi:hypothetical protein
VWDDNKGENNLTLPEQVDFMHKLSAQFPPPPHRILYTKGGQYLAAARIEDQRAIIDHMLYWATASSVEEARYLVAVLNSPALAALVVPLQARGEHNPRHFDKQVWRLPIPLYDSVNGEHRQLAALAAEAEVIAAKVDVSVQRTFQAQRRLVRQELERQGLSQTIDELVVSLLAP